VKVIPGEAELCKKPCAYSGPTVSGGRKRRVPKKSCSSRTGSGKHKGLERPEK